MANHEAGGAGPVSRPAPEPVPGWRRAMPLAAAVICALATAWMFAQSAVNGNTLVSGVAGVIITGLIAAIAFASEGSFARMCLASGLALVPVAIVGVFFALFAFLPATPVLLAAWLADPRARPRTARVLAVLAAAVFLVMVVVWSVAITRTFG